MTSIKILLGILGFSNLILLVASEFCSILLFASFTIANSGYSGVIKSSISRFCSWLICWIPSIMLSVNFDASLSLSSEESSPTNTNLCLVCLTTLIYVILLRRKVCFDRTVLSPSTLYWTKPLILSFFSLIILFSGDPKRSTFLSVKFYYFSIKF